LKFLICDGIDQAAVDVVREAGHEAIEATGLAGDELVAALEGCSALLVRGATKVTADVLQRADALKIVVRAGTGLDNVDRSAAKASGVEVRNTPAANGVSVAELTFGLLLALERHIAPASTALAGGRWEKKKYKGREIAGRRLGLVGFGRIGREVALRARAFGMQVAACDPALTEWPSGFEWVESRELDSMLPDIDVLSLHVPLTDSTRNCIDAAQLALMKPDAVLVNAARGGTVNEDALLEALKNGTIRGAAIDVFDTEPPGDHPLLALPNVLATPHVGASTKEAQVRAGVQAAEIAVEVLKGAVTA
jgi:D-3-phosphoglycerate dehydrogenase